MKLPDKKGGAKLPPHTVGGGAAARQRQAELERGMAADESVEASAAAGEAPGTPPEPPTPPKPPKKKKPRK